MVEQMRALSREDAASIAAMHLEALPDSVVSRLGRRYAQSFYRYIARSTREVLLVARPGPGSPIVGACALSFDPSSLDRRLLAGSGLIAALAIRPHVLAQAYFPEGSNGSALPDRLPDDLMDYPEVVTIFAHAAQRGRGVGTLLLKATERRLRERGLQAYLVKTLDDEGNRALKFYLDNGFTQRARYRKYGRCFRVLAKDVDPATSEGSKAGS